MLLGRFGCQLVTYTVRIANVSNVIHCYTIFWHCRLSQRGLGGGTERSRKALGRPEHRKTPGSRKEPAKDTPDPPRTPEMLPRNRTGRAGRPEGRSREAGPPPLGLQVTPVCPRTPKMSAPGHEMGGNFPAWGPQKS